MLIFILWTCIEPRAKSTVVCASGAILEAQFSLSRLLVVVVVVVVLAGHAQLHGHV